MINGSIGARLAKLGASRTDTLIWLVASFIAALSCSLYLDAAFVGGEYVPVGNDSFYHARRILDTAANPGAFYQFDPKIHAPEGSMLVWPWGYDYAMAHIVRLVHAIAPGVQPIAILLWIPVAAVFISTLLIVRIARLLSFSTGFTALAAVLCFALAPTTQFLHGVGQIDHHFAEMIFLLAMLACGMRWLSQPENKKTAASLAIVLGIAPAIHNGLFILQIPVLAVLMLRWVQGIPLDTRAASTFATTLVLTIIAILIPSLPFRLGAFEFFTLSWFHLYVTMSTALLVVAMSRFACTARSSMLLVGIGAALAVPIVTQISLAQSFITGTLKWLETINEMKSPVREAFESGAFKAVSGIYSYLFWIAPATILVCIVRGWLERASPRLLFWICAVCGLGLLSAQVRMHYFGDFALYFPWLILASDYARSRPEQARKVVLGTSMAMLLLV